jgi:hypothetical protein
MEEGLEKEGRTVSVYVVFKAVVSFYQEFPGRNF